MVHGKVGGIYLLVVGELSHHYSENKTHSHDYSNHVCLVKCHSHYYPCFKFLCATIQEQPLIKGGIYYTKAPSVQLLFNIA